MPRAIVLATAFVFLGTPAFTQTPMKPTAPQKMMSPEEQKKVQACEKQAADRNIQMDQRAKFVMNCVTTKK
jgi:hypothetical protein